MNKFAILTQDLAGAEAWEVFQLIRLADSEDSTDLVNLIKEALLSNAVISGVNASTAGESLKRGAIWDGTNFSGGTEYQPSFLNSSRTKKFALLENQKILLVFTAVEDSIEDELYSAAWSQNLKIIQVLEDQTVAPGYTWDGTNFNSSL